MKYLFLILSSVFAMSSAWACNPKAQFTGTIKNLSLPITSEGSTLVHTTYQLSFSSYTADKNCPLAFADAQKAVVTNYGSGRDLSEGRAISGVLTYTTDWQEYSVIEN